MHDGINKQYSTLKIEESEKGFAVVAAEVRKLAEQSKNSSDTISEIITGLQEKTNRSVVGVTRLEEVFLSNISRALKENITLNKIIFF